MPSNKILNNWFKVIFDDYSLNFKTLKMAHNVFYRTPVTEKLPKVKLIFWCYTIRQTIVSLQSSEKLNDEAFVIKSLLWYQI